MAAVFCIPAYSQVIEPPRLRTLLPNGATILVENMPDAKVISIQLFASSLRFPDSSEDHGYKHLLEHLILKGPDKGMDQKMETQGIFFTGHTLRDAMVIEYTCAPGQIMTCLESLQTLLAPLHTSAQEIANEVKIMRQEQALESDSQRLSAAAWTLAYGDRGLSPFGDLDVMAAATPDQLRAYEEELFSAGNLVLVISGAVDIESETKVCASFLGRLAKKAGDEPEPRPAGSPGRVQVDSAFGEARAARVGGFKDEKTAWTLAAALALATQLGPVFVTYTPSADNGLVILGKTDANVGVGLKIDDMAPGDFTALYPIGKALARRWVQRQLENPSSSAALRGILLCQGPSYTPESMLEAIDHMTWQNFFQGAALFNKDVADIVVGTR